MSEKISIEKIKWDPKIYPREKYSTATIDRYKDAIEAGDEFPPLILEKDTLRLLDGKHRYEAFKKAEVKEVQVEYTVIPEGMTAKFYAATLSARHGDRLSNSDLKILAEEEFQATFDAKEELPDPQTWGAFFGISKSTVYRWVSHIINKAKATREENAYRLSLLGWTQEEIADRLGVTHQQISLDAKNSHMGNICNILGPSWNEKGLQEYCTRTGCDMTLALAATMKEYDDTKRVEQLNIKLQPYDVWHFASNHDFMGSEYPGRIPGELICHVLYFYTNAGDMILDPMAGSGTTLDACLLMGRKCRGYDLKPFKERIDIVQHDLSTGWPEAIKKASLVFWDPPYFSKKNDEYPDGSISELDREAYLKFMSDSISNLYKSMKPKTKFAFLMSDWDGKEESKGIFIWDYTSIMQKAGFELLRQIQTPLNTQQIHPDFVLKFRKTKKLAVLDRYLIIAEKQ